MDGFINQRLLNQKQLLRFILYLVHGFLIWVPSGTINPFGVPTMAQTYIPDNAYELLLLALENPTPAAYRRTQIIEALGDIAGIWPASCLTDQLENAA
jgi:hypothetical protein